MNHQIIAALQQLPDDAGADAIAAAIAKTLGPGESLELVSRLAAAAWAARQPTL